jgi:crotonobetaine/carnitine-CoA ligase
VEVDRITTRLAHGFAKLGVKQGDRVCSMLDNGSAQLFVWWAVNKLGCIYVPMNTDLKGEFLRHQVSETEAVIAVVEPHYEERIALIRESLPALKTIILNDSITALDKGGAIKLSSLRTENDTAIPVTVAPNDLSLLIYTSGTTGPSKGCMLSHNYVTNFGLGLSRSAGYGHDDVVGTPCPLFHMAALGAVVMGGLRVGATVAIQPRFSPATFWAELEQAGITVVLLVSIMVTIIPDQPDNEASLRYHGKLRTVFGAPVPAAVARKWKERFGVTHAGECGYGLTECTPTIFNYVEGPELPPGAAGKVFDDIEVKLIDENGEECDVGKPGEIIIRPRRPDIMFQGYWRRPEATIAAMKDYWFHTGDMGRFDENGYFYFYDRKKDYLRKGGENISTFELEATFRAHPAIAEIAAHAVHSELSEDEVKLTAVLRPNVNVTEEELCEWSLDRVPYYAIPRFIEFRAALPKTPTGRVQKYLLRDDGVTTTTWDRKKSNIVVKRR